LLGEASVAGIDVAAGEIEVRASDYGAFTRALPRIAIREGVRVSQLRPSDESLESVFAYLVAS
jgi:ABC-2 type transport system ATP-binding protein